MLTRDMPCSAEGEAAADDAEVPDVAEPREPTEEESMSLPVRCHESSSTFCD